MTYPESRTHAQTNASLSCSEENDGNGPMNWPKARKNGIIGAVCLMRFVTPLASSMMAPALSQIADEFDETNNLLLTCTVSIYLIGFGVGALLMAPLSEVYGRNLPYHTGNVLLTVFTVGCALSPNTASLVIFRILAGIVGSVPLTNGGGTIADIIPVQDRGLIVSIFSLAMIMAPVAGPIAGGFLAGAAGWRWIFWLLTILSGCMTLWGFIFLHETYAPVLQARAHPNPNHTPSALRSKLASSIARPIRMFSADPITPLASLYMGLIYGVLYLLFTTFATVFQTTYGFKEGVAGLAYLGLGIGSAVGLFAYGRYSDRLTTFILGGTGCRGALTPPPPMRPSVPNRPVRLWLVGQFHVHWIIPIVGSGFVGLGAAVAQASIQAYLVDVYTTHAASALAANTLLRILGGGLVPLGGFQMYDRLGLDWGNSLLGFLTVFFAVGPVSLWAFGARWRGRGMGRRTRQW